MSEIVLAIYQPHEGKEGELDQLVGRHLPLLRKKGLVTARQAVRMRSASHAVVEVFEWVDAEASGRAHSDPDVSALWEAMAQVAEFPCLADLPEATRRFPHFAPAP